MSGDIGRGATRESIAFAVHLAAAKDKPHGLCIDLLCCHFCNHLRLILSSSVGDMHNACNSLSCTCRFLSISRWHKCLHG